MRVYLRELYNKHTSEYLDSRVRVHLLAVARSEITPKFGLRREPKRKNVIGPHAFIYLAYFRWVPDTTTFKIGLDRLDDATARILFMYTGCRKHELVCTKPKDFTGLLTEFHEDSDAYTDADADADEYVEARAKTCWVCGEADERTELRRKVLCCEDIDLWILQDPMGNGGRDYLAAQILLRFHKGHNKEVVPTWYLLVEEKLPLLCPVSHILAKALAEGVVQKEGYQTRAEPFFSTKIGTRGIKIQWKREFMHKPVFRQIVPSVHGFEKSDDPLTSHMFDNNSDKLGTAAGLPDRLRQYDYRWGNLETVDSKSSRHRC